jgi:hypothetical protein
MMAVVGADVDTGLAGAAVVGFRCVDRQGQVGIDFTEKKPRAMVAAEQQGVFAAPAEPALAGEFDFHHRCAVGEYPVMMFADRGADALGQLLQTRPHDFMVVAPEGIAGYIGAAGFVQYLFRIGRSGWKIIEPDGDHAACTRNQFGRPAFAWCRGSPYNPSRHENPFRATAAGRFPRPTGRSR